MELAQSEYLLPRLAGQWSHLERLGGGIGTRGPGETQIETDRRQVRGRISALKRELEEVRRHRQNYRQRRRRQGIPVAALVGYTNAGKSTLLNALTSAGVLAEDKLFATLDPITRKIELPGGQPALITDTVGFIQKLPTALVAAFRATLEELDDADLLIHVLDITHPNAEEQRATVENVLKDLHLENKPTLMALNKVDQLVPEDADDPDAALAAIARDMRIGDEAILVSARQGWGLPALRTRIGQLIAETWIDIKVTIPYTYNPLVRAFHNRGRVTAEQYTENGTAIEGKVPPDLAASLEPYRDRG